jgi:hypothetical protein
MNFDLNINNSTQNELLNLFGLPSNYDKFIVESKENKLKDKIIFSLNKNLVQKYISKRIVQRKELPISSV